MEIHPEIAELKHMIQQTNDLVLQLAKDVTRDISQMRGELNQMNERFSSFENHVDQRFGSLENRIGGLEGRMASLEGSMGTVESRITDLFKWMVGLMIPLWIGILIAVLTQLIKG